MLRLLEETTLPDDYDAVGTLTLERIPEIRMPVVLMYARSARRSSSTFEYLRDAPARRRADPAAVDGVGPLRAARAARARGRATCSPGCCPETAEPAEAVNG